MTAAIDPSAAAWQCAVDACLEHDCAHAQRAWRELDRLGELLPAPRPPSHDESTA